MSQKCVVGMGKKSPDGSEVDLATSLRRTARLQQEAFALKRMIGEMCRRSSSAREMYQTGEQAGRNQVVGTLTDVLFNLKESGLGRTSILQESNSHMIFKVQDCVCCVENRGAGNCSYMAGYLAGVLKANNKPDTVRVEEVSCGEYPGRTCIFVAKW